MIEVGASKATKTFTGQAFRFHKIRQLHKQKGEITLLPIVSPVPDQRGEKRMPKKDETKKESDQNIPFQGYRA